MTGEYKGVHIFLKGISTNMDVIALLEFELAYFATQIHHFSHYALYKFIRVEKKWTNSIMAYQKDTFFCLQWPN